MGATSAAAVVRGYFSGHGTDAFATDATFEFVPLGQTFTGPAQIQGTLDVFYHEAFPGATADEPTFVDGARAVAVEWTFRGTNTGPLMGAPPTGRTMALRMVGIYEVEQGKIQRARVYWDGADFARQLGIG